MIIKKGAEAYLFLRSLPGR
ncbi:MAG: hypothetical protein KIH01_07095, partial [Candidatus Freyarchaeota archaeon]|nr:hypothetical protein [Candidatus Jordarchaeia archaeon]